MSGVSDSMARLYAAAAKLRSPIDGPTELANALGQSPQTVTNWAKRGVSLDGAIEAQKALRISATHVLEGDQPVYVPATASVSPDEITPGYVQVGLLSGVGGMGDGIENDDFPEVIREMSLSEHHVRSILGFLPRPGRLAMMTGRGSSMEPLIKSGDVVLVDTRITFFDGDGPYVINLGSGQQIKNLQERGDGLYVISANSLAGLPPFKAPDDLLIGGRVYAVQTFTKTA